MKYAYECIISTNQCCSIQQTIFGRIAQNECLESLQKGKAPANESLKIRRRRECAIACLRALYAAQAANPSLNPVLAEQFSAKFGGVEGSELYGKCRALN
uniref:Uncharacterized protein n=1 Tax=Spironucleus salmonicida TaxID=348837 RepID=V6LST0_9EUKA|eukprot:EST47308.1 Hypothetical protein SS50377_12626 [Spironucleus salmonicida]